VPLRINLAATYNPESGSRRLVAKIPNPNKITLDRELSAREVQDLSSPDAVAYLFNNRLLHSGVDTVLENGFLAADLLQSGLAAGLIEFLGSDRNCSPNSP
jgi:hypothetical protein